MCGCDGAHTCGADHLTDREAALVFAVMRTPGGYAAWSVRDVFTSNA